MMKFEHFSKTDRNNSAGIYTGCKIHIFSDSGVNTVLFCQNPVKKIAGEVLASIVDAL